MPELKRTFEQVTYVIYSWEDLWHSFLLHESHSAASWNWAGQAGSEGWHPDASVLPLAEGSASQLAPWPKPHGQRLPGHHGVRLPGQKTSGAFPVKISGQLESQTGRDVSGHTDATPSRVSLSQNRTRLVLSQIGHYTSPICLLDAGTCSILLFTHPP